MDEDEDESLLQFGIGWGEENLKFKLFEVIKILEEISIYFALFVKLPFNFYL